MRLSTLCAAALLAVGSIGLANATSIITNGDFSQNTSPNGSIPTQFGGSVQTGFDANGSCSFGGDFVTGWTGNGGYEIWYPSASAATGTTSCNQYNGNPTQRLAGVTTAPGPNGTFVGLDGQEGIGSSISQSVSLISGAQYTLGFWWGATQEMSRLCTPGYPADCLSETLTASIGNTSQAFSVNNYTQQTFTGWQYESFTFTADSSSTMLSFLSAGQPGLPPFAVLTGITLSQTNVPEPPVLALFGGGLLGLGLLTVFARRRALHEKHDLA